MKPDEFRNALNKAADLVAPYDADPLRVLAELFASSQTKTVAATIARLRKTPLAPEPELPSIGELISVLMRLHEFLKECGKPVFAKDVEAVASFLREFTNAGVKEFVN